MKLLRSVISLISKNTTNELNLLRQNRFFCTAKSGYSETKSNENVLDSKNRTSVTESDDDDVMVNKKIIVDKSDAIQRDIESGILITSYSTVRGI